MSNGIEVDAQPQPDEDVDAQHDQDSSTFDAVTEIHVAEVRRVALSFTSPAPGSGPQNEWIRMLTIFVFFLCGEFIS